MSAAPALPWGAAPAAPAAEGIEPDLGVKLGLLGTRIEVKWEVEGDATNASEVKWWGAVVEAGPADARDGDGRKVYVIRYDADPAAGYAETTTNAVTFLDDHELYDLDADDELVWRREGDAWDEEARSDGGEGDEEGEPAAVTLAEVEQAMSAWDRRRGYTSEQVCTAMLGELPPEQQRSVAAGFQDFSAKLAAGVKALYEAHGPDHVISRADVEEMLGRHGGPGGAGGAGGGAF